MGKKYLFLYITVKIEIASPPPPKVPPTTKMSNYFQLKETENIAIRAINHLLEPSAEHVKYADTYMVASYEAWSSLRGLSYPALPLPPDDEEHQACRRMWAVEMSRRIQSEYVTKAYLPGAVAAVVEARASRRAEHDGCTCTVPHNGWKGEEGMRILAPLNPTHNRYCECGGWLTCPVQGRSPNSAVALMAFSPPPDSIHAAFCTCVLCNKRPLEKAEDAFVMAAKGIAAAKDMPGGNTEDGFAKNLFQTIQGVKYDDKCPHGMPFYACMPCSH